MELTCSLRLMPWKKKKKSPQKFRESLVSGFLDEPTHIEGAQVILAQELSDEESFMNQPIPAIPAAHDLIVFPEEMYAQVMEAACHHGVEFDSMFAIYPPSRQ